MVEKYSAVEFQSSRPRKSAKLSDTMLRKLTSLREVFGPIYNPLRTERDLPPENGKNGWKDPWEIEDTGRARSEIEQPIHHGVTINPVQDVDYFEPLMQQYNLTDWTGGVTSGTAQGGFDASLGQSVLHVSTRSAEQTTLLMNSTTYEEFWPFNFSSWCQYNDTNCWNSTSTEEEAQLKYWCLLLLIFPFFTVFGNILVVLSVVKERSLRTATNYFIVSLGVADLLVAVLVMPPAVYIEVTGGKWTLNNVLCDAWIAADVMACTASILNLTAISVDRFIAVTQPIKYSKHKNSKRFWIMLALTWVISFAIAAPIALGVNYSKDRVDTICIFYNSDFLIYSSMGSFYIPSIIMLFLYGKIYFVLRQRAKKFLARKAKTVDSKSLQNVIENTATTAGGGNLTRTAETVLTDNLHDRNNIYARTGARLSGAHSGSMTLCPNPIHDEVSTALHTTSSTHEDDEDDEDDGATYHGDEDLKGHVIQNDKTAEFLMSPVSEDNSTSGRSGYAPPNTVEVETGFSSTPLGTVPQCNEQKGMLALPKKKFPGLSRNGSAKKKKSGGKKSVTRFNFHMRHSKKKKDKSATRRERKATKTLAIVLGVFLLCWWPFFTINILDAICIRYNLKNTVAACDMPRMLFSFFVWLGYINSFLNPVIYTIFNMEFRKAFKKLLMEPCAK